MGDLVLLGDTLSEDREEAKEQLASMLENLLERVKAGDIIGLAYAACGTNDTANGWSGYSCRNDLSLSISLLDTRYHNACLE